MKRMTDEKKPDRGKLEIDTEECKGCGLCIEACPPKVISLERTAESLRLSHGGVCGFGLHGMRHLLYGVPRAGRYHRVSRLVIAGPDPFRDKAAEKDGATRSGLEGAAACESN